MLIKLRLTGLIDLFLIILIMRLQGGDRIGYVSKGIAYDNEDRVRRDNKAKDLV